MLDPATSDEGLALAAAPAEPVERAVAMLLRAGMVERYRSKSGSSIYLGWPGRDGVLRVSDHRSAARKGLEGRILARLTLHASSTPKSDLDWARRVGDALGRYILLSGRAHG